MINSFFRRKLCPNPLAQLQALTNPEIFRLPIGQPAGKNQVAPIKIQVAPIRQAPGWWFNAVWQNEISVDFAAK